MQHLNWFFVKKMDATYIQSRTHSVPTVSPIGTENTGQPTGKAKQAGAGAAIGRQPLEAQLVLTDLAGGVEQVDISIFCLEDFHPHSNKTKVPQASPGH